MNTQSDPFRHMDVSGLVPSRKEDNPSQYSDLNYLFNPNEKYMFHNLNFLKDVTGHQYPTLIDQTASTLLTY